MYIARNTIKDEKRMSIGMGRQTRSVSVIFIIVFTLTISKIYHRSLYKSSLHKQCSEACYLATFRFSYLRYISVVAQLNNLLHTIFLLYSFFLIFSYSLTNQIFYFYTRATSLMQLTAKMSVQLPFCHCENV